jgi:hypothetical protein
MIPLGRSRRRREDNIKIELKVVGWGHDLDCFGSGLWTVGGLF